MCRMIAQKVVMWTERRNHNADEEAVMVSQAPLLTNNDSEMVSNFIVLNYDRVQY